jgi:adhesin transport system membrane fusion protein
MNEIATQANVPEESNKVRRGDRQTRFLAQSVILEEAGSSGLVRAAMIAIAVVICAFLIWAGVTKVDEVAVTTGEIIPTGKVQTIQHLEGGIISQINVDEGELVEKEQVLLVLEPSGPTSELNQIRARRAALELQVERLRAIGTGREPDFTFINAEFNDMIEDQRIIYDSQQEAHLDRQQVIITQIEQKKQELFLLEEQEETLSRNADLLLEEFLLREELYKKGLTTKIAYLDSKRAVNDSRGELANLLVDRQRTTESLEESRNRLTELDTDNREQVLTEMGVVTNELAQVVQSLEKTFDRVRRLKVQAPVRGYVKGLKVNTVGGVIPAGAIVMELVPLDEELVVEARINTRDVGHVEPGKPVTIKVTTYDFARYGGITGELKEISATTFIDEASGDPYYKGVVTLDRNYVGFEPGVNQVLPGMTVQADIITGNKTLLEYLLKPVVSSVKTSFKER